MSEKIHTSLFALCVTLYFLDHSIISLGLRYLGLLHPMLSWIHFLSWMMPPLNIIIDPIEMQSSTLLHSISLFLFQWLIELDDYFRLNDESLEIGFSHLKRYYNQDPVQSYEQLPV
eukprot:NODE_78_length_23230_cov_1.644979.p13 type:complete len:116 gc:universal NODE_78_length_23230_cov_1.644979:13885-14232(+)